MYMYMYMYTSGMDVDRVREYYAAKQTAEFFVRG